jgi:hypothetical protein
VEVYEMKTTQHFMAKMRDRKGATAVVVALCLVVLIGFVALAVDVGYMMTTRNELQNVADAAALAGARTLGRLYQCNGDLTDVTCPKPMPYENQLTYVADATAIKAAATDTALRNQAGGMSGITIDNAEIVIGNWDGTKQTSPKPIDCRSNPALSATLTSPDAVCVTARRDSSANGAINTFFAGILGINTVEVSAAATAALTGSSSMAPGGLPVAINKSWMSTLPCNSNLTFHPSSAGVCAAWHVYDGTTYKQPSASKIRDMINAFAQNASPTPINPYNPPETIAGETQYDFTNGTLASLFTSTTIQNLFNVMRVLNDGKYDFDADAATWTTSVPIFDDITEGCNPNGDITIVGFATILITGVDPPPVTTIYATVKCDNVEPGRGGGSYYGTKGAIPNLVQ